MDRNMIVIVAIVAHKQPSDVAVSAHEPKLKHRNRSYRHTNKKPSIYSNVNKKSWVSKRCLAY